VLFAVSGPAAGEPDAPDLDACRRGDRAALERVLLAEAPSVERLLRRMVGPGREVEDLMQDVFVAAIQAFPRFRGQSSVRTWLARIAVTTATDHFRRPLRRQQATLRLVASEGDRVESPPDEALEQRQVVARLHHHLSRLSPKTRVALLLHIVDARPMAEVAALMDATVAATKTRVFLGRRSLLGWVKSDRALRELLGETTMRRAAIDEEPGR
jgi:RNA polymerase sigma-70 factor (ECF subfamily)